MFGFSPIKILFIVALILIVLGPDKLPEVARQLGTGWRKLKTLQEKIESEVREVVPDLPTSADIVRMARSPVNILNELADRVLTIEPDEAGTTTSPPAETVTFDDHPETKDEALETEHEYTAPIERSASSVAPEFPVADPSLN